jgi:hypothetical protein
MRAAGRAAAALPPTAHARGPRHAPLLPLCSDAAAPRPGPRAPQLVKKRPLSPDVFEIDMKGPHYKFPWGAISSIGNRVTGVTLSAGAAVPQRRRPPAGRGRGPGPGPVNARRRPAAARRATHRPRTFLCLLA